MSVEQPGSTSDDATDLPTATDAASASARPRISRNVKIGAAAAAGIGSAAIAAALLYASRARKAETPKVRGEPEDQATD